MSSLSLSLRQQKAVHVLVLELELAVRLAKRFGFFQIYLSKHESWLGLPSILGA